MTLTEHEQNLIFRDRAFKANKTRRKTMIAVAIMGVFVLADAILMMTKIVSSGYGVLIFIALYLLLQFITYRIQKRETLLMKELKENGL